MGWDQNGARGARPPSGAQSARSFERAPRPCHDGQLVGPLPAAIHGIAQTRCHRLLGNLSCGRTSWTPTVAALPPRTWSSRSTLLPSRYSLHRRSAETLDALQPRERSSTVLRVDRRPDEVERGMRRLGIEPRTY